MRLVIPSTSGIISRGHKRLKRKQVIITQRKNTTGIVSRPFTLWTGLEKQVLLEPDLRPEEHGPWRPKDQFVLQPVFHELVLGDPGLRRPLYTVALSLRGKGLHSVLAAPATTGASLWEDISERTGS